jgi:hypothetical protein
VIYLVDVAGLFPRRTVFHNEEASPIGALGGPTMTSLNQTGKDVKTLTTPEDDAAVKAAEPSEEKRELTDDEIASVAGGLQWGAGRGVSAPS